MNAKLVEAVARAQYEFFGRAWRLKWDELAPKGQKTMYRECARAALAAIEAEGCRVVPVEPTEAMLDAGGSSVVRPSVYMGGTPPGAMRRARDIWAAMLAAAKEQP